LGVTSTALAQDLTITSVQVTQCVQTGTNPLVGNNTTILRVSVGTGGATFGNVDAVVRMSVNNVPVPGAPIFSLNGPITAVSAPNLANINDTINFMVIPPVSTDVDFVVQVNPNRNVIETNYNNNTFTVSNQNFLCRRVTEMPYVPINYTYSGDTPPNWGMPPANLMEPGIGDGFIRGIYSTEWNYHKSPLPPLNWTTNIDSTSNTLLNTLNDIRLNQIPDAGYPQAPLIYGWLPGNPYSGNGQAIGIPGNAAFGNTDPMRFQRTAAHELGHLFNMQHVTAATMTTGFDEEHHLRDTQNLPQLQPATQRDIMQAGLLTHEAWIRSQSYNTALNDSKLACSASDAPEGVPPVPVLRVSGVITHDTRAVDLSPVMRIARGHLTQDNPIGDIRLQALNGRGRVIWSVGYRSDTAREMCAVADDGGHAHMLQPDGAFYALFPETVGGEAVDQVRVVDVATGNILASRVRSANAPQNAIIAMRLVQLGEHNDAPAGRAAFDANDLTLAGRMRVEWTAHDVDDDALTHNLLYSPDAGESWYPVVVNSTESSFEFQTTDIPTSNGANGGFMLVTSDGLNNTSTSTFTSDEGGIAVGPGNPPQTFLITPNTGDSFRQLAAIPFHGTSWDMENLLLDGGNMVWTSSIDGEIGTGRLFTKYDLSPGTHVITLTGTDLNGLSTSKQITITVTPRTVINPDCNENWVLDLVDILNGTSLDLNSNGIPDECESQICVGDTDNSGAVDADDLTTVILAWGPCPAPPAPCPADVDDNNVVNADDLVTVILNWGACP
jgi:hypothetical protein